MDFPILTIWISILSFEGHKEHFDIFVSLIYENHLSKNNSPRWDATFCGFTSLAILFVYMHVGSIKRMPGLYGLSQQ